MTVARLLVASFAAVALGVAAAVVHDAPRADAVDATRVIGRYVLRLRGDGFDRDAQSLDYRARALRGTAVLIVSRAEAAASAREVEVEVVLSKQLQGSVLDRATPTPALRGKGLLIGDSLTVIGSGQANFVNALTLRFKKKGTRLDGWWLASFPAADLASGFAGGVGLQIRGRLQRPSAVQPTAVTVRDVGTVLPGNSR